jgi:ribosomal protein L24E
MTKCIWCNREVAPGEGTAVEFDYGTARACSDACNEDYYRFARYVHRSKWRFIGLMLAVCLAGTVVTFLNMKHDNGALGTFIVLTGMGVVIRKYPFTTPQFVESHGGKEAVRFARRAALYLIFAGIAAGLLLYFL